MMLEGDANSSGELFRILKKAVDEVPTGPATTDITGSMSLAIGRLVFYRPGCSI
jgi:hypothetical protein